MLESNSSRLVCVMLSTHLFILFFERSHSLIHVAFRFYNDGLLPKEHHGPLCLHLPKSISSHHHPQLFIWVLRVTFRTIIFWGRHIINMGQLQKRYVRFKLISHQPQKFFFSLLASTVLQITLRKLSKILWVFKCIAKHWFYFHSVLRTCKKVIL